MNRNNSISMPGPAGAWRHYLAVWLLALLLAVTGLTACGGKGDEQAAFQEDNGELSISLTDAEGDFVSYTVDVVSLSLTRANGTVVETLPIKTRVDFAQYTDMTEFLTIATVPAGVYVKGSLVLDYSNAEILVENAAGDPVTVSGADIRDKAGKVVDSMTMSVSLEGKNHLTIVPGVPSHLSLDFDLQASHSVIFNEGTPQVTVSPYLLADVDVEHNKPHRARGPLKDVQLEASKFQVYVRPFTHLINGAQNHFGVLNIHTADSTLFEIDGVTYTGATGLALLADMPQFSAVVAIGDVKHHPRRFDAKLVYAGSSVPGGDMDVVRGSVVSRSADMLTVKGMIFLRDNGNISFNKTVLVSLADSTTILKALKLGSFNKGDISVGQYVTVFGNLANNDPGEPILDAANGYARMELSNLKASRVGVVYIPEEPPLYPFVLNVSRINGRDISQYDFTGTGTDAANDAQADFYEVDNGPLDVSGISTGATVRVRGHATPFGSAPADFEAMTIINLSPNKK